MQINQNLPGEFRFGAYDQVPSVHGHHDALPYEAFGNTAR